MSDEILLNHPSNHRKLLLNSHPTPIEQLFHMNDILKRRTIKPEYTDVSQFDLEIGSSLQRINFSRTLSEEQVQQDPFEERNPQESSQQLPQHFKNINKWSLKDICPFPKIDQILQEVIEPSRTSLIDGFTGHDQVTMDLKNEKKTSLISPWGAS